MATEKLRAELELITSKAEKDLARFHRSLKSVEKTVTSIGGKGGKSMRPLGEGLSAATANASEFEKSMAAANARVIAFGASAGLIMQVQRALKEAVKSTIEVEKALTDINIVLNANTAGLQKFGNQLFKIAGQTGQSFKVIAVGATELARQGLGTEKTLSRLNDAMILSRLTGMGAEEAVSNLTAAVNSFNKAGITSAQVINKMAKVDQAFAVSSDDLAKALSRVGSSAVDAGVSMDELLAITTAVQQRTARGGAVIGNAFKTIFTRIGRTDVQKKLNAIGVETRDMQGHMLGATKVLQNLADKFGTLGKMQQNQLAESVAGVFQVNILRAALGDLSSQYGINARALKISASATDEAYKKNEKLNETLDALANKTLVNLTKAGAGIGGATLKPAIENVLNLVNGAIGAFSEGGRFEEFGKGIGKDLLTGLGNFISGPGLAIITIGIGKLAINFASFAKTAIAGVLELNKNALARKGIEDSVTAALMKQPGIIKQIERGELSAATAARDMLASMRAQNMEASKLAVTSRVIAGNMMGMGTRGGRGGGRPGRASGLVPNFASPSAERASAAAGGYRAGAIKTMNVPGEGSVMYNGAETVKRFPGMVQPAIMPPKESPAGANYKSSFGAAHGFDPYAASGFVPNYSRASEIFAKGLRNVTAGKTQGFNAQKGELRRRNPDGSYVHGKEGREYANRLESELEARAMSVKAGAGEVKEKAKLRRFDTAKTLGLLGIGGSHSGSSTTGLDQIGRFREGSGLSIAQLKKYRVTFDNMQSRSIDEIKGSKNNLQKFSDKVSELLTDPIAKLSNIVFDNALGNDNDVSIEDLKKKFKGNTQLLPPGAEGSIFEAAINLGLLTTKTSAKAKKDAFDQSTKGAQKPFDFEEVGPAKPDFKSIFKFHDSLVYADAKRTIDNKSMGSLINKAYNRGIAGLPYMELLQGANVAAAGTASKKTSKRKKRASGHVPNFSSLGDAVTRERAAGVPVSAIRVSSSPALEALGNPGGLGVHNTIDEPAGLEQGISRSRRMGIDPKTHGAAGGFVPNFPRILRPGSKYGGVKHSAETARYPELDMSRGVKMMSPVESSHKRLDKALGGGKDEKTSETNKEASVEMLAAANLMNAGTGKLMGLATVGYMAGGPIMKSLGADERQSNFMMESAMKFGMVGMLSSQMAGSANPFKGMGGAAASGFSRGSAPAIGPVPKKQGFGQKMWGGMKAAGSNLIGKKPGASFSTIGAKGAGKAIGSKVIPGLGWGLAGYDVATGFMDGWKESPAEKRLREAQEARGAMEQNDVRPLIEQVGSQVSTFSGGFGVSSGKVRGQQFGDLKKMVFGGGGLMERSQGDDKTTVLNEYKEFTSSFSQGAKAVETAGEKFNKAILKVAESIEIANDKATEEERIATLGVQVEQGAFNKGTKIDPLTTGDIVSPRQYYNPGTGTLQDVPQSESMGHSDAQVNKLANFIKGSMQGGVAGANQRIEEEARALKDFGIHFDKTGKQVKAPPLTSDQLTELVQESGALGGSKNLLGISMKEYEATLNAGGGSLGGDTPEIVKKAMAQVLSELHSGPALSAILADKEVMNAPKADDGFTDTLRGREGESNRKIQKIAFEKAKALTLLEEKSAQLKRQYNQALGESTRGMYGEVGIKLSESKTAAKEAYDRVTKSIDDDLKGAESKKDVSIALARGAAKRKFTDPDMQGKMTKRIDEIMTMRDSRLDDQLAWQETVKASSTEGSQDKIYAETLIPIIKARIEFAEAQKKRTALTETASKSLTTANDNAGVQNRIDKQLIDNKYKYNRILDLQIRNAEANLAADRASYGKEDVASGRITGSQFAQDQRALRSKLRDAGGMKGITTYDPETGKATRAPGAEQASMGDIFREEWAYGPRQQAEDFEAGMADVAVTVKDSMKEAIKNIASGADSFKDAMFNVFAALADKLADQGISMGVDTAFDWLSNLGGSKHGGSIPRGYNKGGVVTGGSGVRDDVMTRMQGGEYVIKKSAAQKIGYETLSSINSYAGGGQARVSLAKEFLYTGDDPKRPTGGKYNVSRNLSTAALFREDDPQTGEMFGRQETLTNYLEYRRKEQERRDKILDNIKRQKRQRLTSAYMSAAMRIGVAAIPAKAPTIGGKAPLSTGGEDQSPTWPTTNDWSGARGGSPAMVMGGEYIMSPRTVSKYGAGFMSQLNQGRLPSFQSGGPVGGGAAMAAGITTNNVSLSVNIDKSGGATAETGKGSRDRTKNDERGDAEEAQSSKEFAEAIRGAVLKEITKQQRPGGLLRDGATWAAGRRT